ncbi:hypothetical protein [Desulfovulcanus sp.]
MDIQTNYSMAMLTNSLQQSQLAADVIQQTIQQMNQYQYGQANQNQDAQTTILQANYDGRGTMINKLV